MKIRFLVSCLFILLLSNNSFAKGRCDIFYEKIKQDYDVMELEYDEMSSYTTLGFDTQVKWDKSMGRIYNPGDSNFKIDDYAEVSEILRINKELEKNKKIKN